MILRARRYELTVEKLSSGKAKSELRILNLREGNGSRQEKDEIRRKN
jgi:hypothetical protein